MMLNIVFLQMWIIRLITMNKVEYSQLVDKIINEHMENEDSTVFIQMLICIQQFS